MFASRKLVKAASALYDDHGQHIYVVERLVAKRTRKRATQYLVKWLGLPDSEQSWEPQTKLKKLSHWNHLLEAYASRGRM